MALAAADKDQEKIVATHLRLAPDPEDPLVTSITPFYCVIHTETSTDESYTVSGTLADQHFDLEKTRFSCYLAAALLQASEKIFRKLRPFLMDQPDLTALPGFVPLPDPPGLWLSVPVVFTVSVRAHIRFFIVGNAAWAGSTAP